MNREMYKIRSLKTEDKALKKIMNMKKLPAEDWNGFLGWWTLFDEVKGIGGQRTLKLTDKVLKPEKAKELKDVMEKIDQWERDLALHLTISEDNKMGEDSKMVIIRDNCPNDLQTLIMNQSNHLTDYKTT